MSRPAFSWTLLGPALLLGEVVFISIPLTLYRGNAGELGDPVWFAGCCVAGFVSLFVLVSVFAYGLGHNRGGQRALAFFGVPAALIVLSDLLLPLKIDLLETGHEVAAEPTGAVFAQLAILAALLVAWWRLPPQAVGRALAWAALLFLLADGVQTGLAMRSSTAAETHAESTRDESGTSFDGNVYHIVFDGFAGPWLQHGVREMDAEEAFRGFVHFRNARSNYVATRLSMPSFDTGRIYDGTEALGDWMESASALSILTWLKVRGFRTTSYSLGGRSANKLADRVVVADPVSPWLAGDLLTLRIAPVFLREEAYRNGRGVVSSVMAGFVDEPIGDLRSYASYSQFRRLLGDEAERPARGEYVFAHINPPHGPFQLDRNGRFHNSNYLEQLYLAVGMMRDLVDTLRAQGKLEQSLVLFQSDHGRGSVIQPDRQPPLRVESMSPEQSDQIRKVDVRGYSGWTLDGRSRALLLVKLPGLQLGGLEIRDELVQLVDVRQIVEQAVDPTRTDRLKPLDLVQLLEREQILYFNGYYQADGPNGEPRVMGRNLQEGSLSRYAVDAQNHWTVLPPQPMVW